MIDKLNPDELKDFSAIGAESGGTKIDFKEILSQIKSKSSKDNNDTK